jgi:hypothetical protein
MTVCSISANALAGDEFRTLQSFYCGVEDAVARSRLFLTRRKLREDILPFRYSEALRHGSETLGHSSFSRVGYSYAIDSWSSYAHQHYDGWIITSPGTPAVTVGIRSVDANALHATAVARDWEQKLMIHVSERPYFTQLDGFFFGVRRPPEALVSDSASLNVRARRILTPRHEKVYFGPCFAHFSALECADLLKSCKLAHVYPKSMHVLRTIRSSSSKWLPMLRDCMLKTGSKRIPALKVGVPTRWTTTWEAMCSLVRCKDALKVGVPTRWTTTWEAMCSLVRCKEAFALLMLTHKSVVNDVVRTKSQTTKALRDCFGYVKDEKFRSDLVAFLDLLIPTVESSLILQGGDATLADVLICKGRQLQALELLEETSAIEALESRWRRLEQPIIIISFFLDPKYRSFAVDGFPPSLNEYVLTDFADGYAKRWGRMRLVVCRLLQELPRRLGTGAKACNRGHKERIVSVEMLISTGLKYYVRI